MLLRVFHAEEASHLVLDKQGKDGKMPEFPLFMGAEGLAVAFGDHRSLFLHAPHEKREPVQGHAGDDMLDAVFLAAVPFIEHGKALALLGKGQDIEPGGLIVAAETAQDALHGSLQGTGAEHGGHAVENDPFLLRGKRAGLLFGNDRDLAAAVLSAEPFPRPVLVRIGKDDHVHRRVFINAADRGGTGKQQAEIRMPVLPHDHAGNKAHIVQTVQLLHDGADIGIGVLDPFLDVILRGCVRVKDQNGILRMLADQAVGAQGKGQADHDEASAPQLVGIRLRRPEKASAHPDQRKGGRGSAAGAQKTFRDIPDGLADAETAHRIALYAVFREKFPFAPLLGIIKAGIQMDIVRLGCPEQIERPGNPADISAAVDPVVLQGVPVFPFFKLSQKTVPAEALPQFSAVRLMEQGDFFPLKNIGIGKALRPGGLIGSILPQFLYGVCGEVDVQTGEKMMAQNLRDRTAGRAVGIDAGNGRKPFLDADGLDGIMIRVADLSIGKGEPAVAASFPVLHDEVSGIRGLAVQEVQREPAEGTGGIRMDQAVLQQGFRKTGQSPVRTAGGISVKGTEGPGGKLHLPEHAVALPERQLEALHAFLKLPPGLHGGGDISGDFDQDRIAAAGAGNPGKAHMPPKQVPPGIPDAVDMLRRAAGGDPFADGPLIIRLVVGMDSHVLQIAGKPEGVRGQAEHIIEAGACIDDPDAVGSLQKADAVFDVFQKDVGLQNGGGNGNAVLHAEKRDVFRRFQMEIVVPVFHGRTEGALRLLIQRLKRHSASGSEVDARAGMHKARVFRGFRKMQVMGEQGRLLKNAFLCDGPRKKDGKQTVFQPSEDIRGPEKRGERLPGVPDGLFLRGVFLPGTVLSVRILRRFPGAAYADQEKGVDIRFPHFLQAAGNMLSDRFIVKKSGQGVFGVFILGLFRNRKLSGFLSGKAAAGVHICLHPGARLV